MLICLHYCRKDQALAAKLAEWLDEIGPFPNHHFLIAHDKNANPDIFAGRKNISVKQVIGIRDDTANKWPESANHAFKKIAKHVQYAMGTVSFLYIEADAVILRGSTFDEIEAEYQLAMKAGKFFLGDLQDAKNNSVAKLPSFVNHCSGIAVYPGKLTEYAGEVFYAEAVPFDIAAGPQIFAQAMQSELILQSWNQNGQGVAPFTSWQDFEQKVLSRRPKCALFHADKQGSLYPFLRERSAFVNTIAPIASELLLCGKPPAENNLQTESASTPPKIGDRWLDDSDEWNGRVWIKTEVTRNALVLTLRDFSKDITTEPWMGQTPWQDRETSINEIQTLAARLKQFQTDMAKIRLVREELHNAGVIKLAYRFKKRKGWKRKRKSK